MAAKTLDFRLQILPVGERYEVRVESPAGEATATFAPPFSEEDLKGFWSRVGRNRLVRSADHPDLALIKRTGEKLFDTVFDADVRDALRVSLDRATQDNATLRILLRLGETPELVDLPWEYLYDRRRDQFLGLGLDSPIVRYLDLPDRLPAVAVTLPLHVLVVVSSPNGLPGLDTVAEIVRLNDALAPLRNGGLVTVDYLGGDDPTRVGPATLEGLRDALLGQRKYHVLHFIGHGRFDAMADGGFLVFETEGGRPRDVGAAALALLLRNHRSIRLVVLNACEGARSSRTDPFAGVAQTLVRQGVAAVVAMQAEISDAAAIVFAKEFYGRIADGEPIETALVRVREALFTRDLYVEWGTPVLYSRAEDGRIFDVAALKTRRTWSGIRDGWGAVRQGFVVMKRWPVVASLIALFLLGLGISQYEEWQRRGPIVIQNFSLSQTEISPGQEVMLIWSVKRATEVHFTTNPEKLLADRVFQLDGVERLRPTKIGTHQITITARSSDESATQTLPITVRDPVSPDPGSPARPRPLPTPASRIKTFTTNRAVARVGEAVELKWSTEGGERVRLEGMLEPGVPFRREFREPDGAFSFSLLDTRRHEFSLTLVKADGTVADRQGVIVIGFDTVLKTRAVTITRLDANNEVVFDAVGRSPLRWAVKEAGPFQVIPRVGTIPAIFPDSRITLTLVPVPSAMIPDTSNHVLVIEYGPIGTTVVADELRVPIRVNVPAVLGVPRK